jgi:amino acid transporter
LKIQFLNNTGFEKIRKIITIFAVFCVGASLSNFRFNKNLSYFLAYCSVVFFIFDLNLGRESKKRSWNNKRFAFMGGFPIFSCLLGFIWLGFVQNNMEVVIYSSIASVIIIIATFINGKSWIKDEIKKKEGSKG